MSGFHVEPDTIEDSAQRIADLAAGAHRAGVYARRHLGFCPMGSGVVYEAFRPLVTGIVLDTVDVTGSLNTVLDGTAEELAGTADYSSPSSSPPSSSPRWDGSRRAAWPRRSSPGWSTWASRR